MKDSKESSQKYKRLDERQMLGKDVMFAAEASLALKIVDCFVHIEVSILHYRAYFTHDRLVSAALSRFGLKLESSLLDLELESVERSMPLEFPKLNAINTYMWKVMLPRVS